MSKQGKLAALLKAIDRYADRCLFPGPSGQQVQSAFADYINAPDDPPPKPEMPECVRHLIELVEAQPYTRNGIAEVLDAVEAHYAQPLKLEVGKVYVDEDRDRVEIIKFNQKFGNYVGLVSRTGVPRIYAPGGQCVTHANAGIKCEVTNG